MKAANFEYLRPSDLPAAVTALAQANGNAKLLAGGQSLGPMLNLRLARPQILIDIARLPELAQVEDRGDSWRIGAAVTHAQLEDARRRLTGCEMVCEVAAGIAYRSVRNLGTIGGSMAHADPAADWPLALAALGATILVRGKSGVRAAPADKFMKAAFTVDLGADEVIEAIDVPKLSAAARYGYYKFCRKTGEYPEASAAAVFDPERRVARIFVGALSGAPQPLSDLASRAAAEGSSVCTRESAATALGQVVPDLSPVERRMQSAAVMRALQKVFQ